MFAFMTLLAAAKPRFADASITNSVVAIAKAITLRGFILSPMD